MEIISHNRHRILPKPVSTIPNSTHSTHFQQTLQTRVLFLERVCSRLLFYTPLLLVQKDKWHKCQPFPLFRIWSTLTKFPYHNNQASWKDTKTMKPRISTSRAALKVQKSPGYPYHRKGSKYLYYNLGNLHRLLKQHLQGPQAQIQVSCTKKKKMRNLSNMKNTD